MRFIDGYKRLVLPTDGRRFQIPLRSLAPADAENLLVGGRCVAGDPVSHASTRNMGCLLCHWPSSRDRHRGVIGNVVWVWGSHECCVYRAGSKRVPAARDAYLKIERNIAFVTYKNLSYFQKKKMTDSSSPIASKLWSDTIDRPPRSANSKAASNSKAISVASSRHHPRQRLTLRRSRQYT